MLNCAAGLWISPMRKTSTTYRGTLLLRALLSVVLLASCLVASIRIAAADAPAAPDYTKPESWAAYPGTASHADDVPPGLSAAHSTGVPVFFVHPTTYLAPMVANASFAPGGAVQAGVDAAVLRFQASVFNECCVIFAPRYRQAWGCRSVRVIEPPAVSFHGTAWPEATRISAARRPP